ncbi:MAG: extracellular solute-binding protein [Clostridiales bacterium]|jgi:putative aldouronate transport system substrate-binding protein|nr:extracellular solute-binding protein [Clostridiales bacterium]
MKKLVSLLLAILMVLGLAPLALMEEPIAISLYYSDNATLPFRQDWPVIQQLEKQYNVKLNFEPIPMADYGTKAGLALSTGENTPDVMLYLSTGGAYASYALNGAIVPISDYAEWTPHFNARVEEMGLQQDVDLNRLSDGKLYFLPSLYDLPFYDGGLIMREDYLKAKGFEPPKTFDDFYNIMKAYKEDFPDSYPLTSIVGLRVVQRMTMPSFGVSVGRNTGTGTGTLSWNYDTNEYFAGAISDEYKAYITFMAKLHAEGLLDPELEQDNASTAKKLATGAAMAVYGYYDQIGGWEQASEIEGLKLNMYPPLEGPGGAHHQPKSKTGGGLLFPIGVSKRADFEQVVRKLDEVFYSEEAAKLWCFGVEGDSYTMDGDKVVYNDTILGSADGIYKYMQNAYGTGCAGLQNVWYLENELTKYDENYARINADVAAMDNAIQYTVPVPSFDDITAEDASLLQTTLLDAFNVWDDEFRTGKKSIETDWDAFVQDMKDKGIEKFLELYNAHKKL